VEEVVGAVAMEVAITADGTVVIVEDIAEVGDGEAEDIILTTLIIPTAAFTSPVITAGSLNGMKTSFDQGSSRIFFGEPSFFSAAALLGSLTTK
jgi:hypothetical protein